MKETARTFAVTAHGDQAYGNDPYVVHLDAVAQLASSFGDAAAVVAYLHDVVEDTEVSLADIAAQFGTFVSDCVAILTDEPGENRHLRKTKTYQKMAEVRGDRELALIVKACDRLANVQACVAQQAMNRLAIYKNEHDLFRSSVYRQGLCDDLWRELETIMALLDLP